MVRWRREVFPANPDTIPEFAAQLGAPEHQAIREFDGGVLESQMIVDAEGDTHLAFWEPGILDNEMDQVERVFADCTFKATPALNEAYQLFTLMAIKYDHVSCDY